MKLNKENVKLSGKGFFVEENQEWLDDNVKIISLGVEFHEVKSAIDGQQRIGWLVMGGLKIVADFTAHTSKGMVGRSVEDNPVYSLIIDKNNKLGDFIAEELIDVNTERSQKLLNKYFTDDINFRGNISIDDNDFEDATLVLISTKSELIFVQTPDSSIRVHSDGVMVLNKKEDKITIISKSDGVVHIESDKSIRIGNGKIMIDGKDFSPAKILSKVAFSLSEAIADLRF